MQTLNKKIGFYGYPAPEVIQEYKLKFPDYEWIDLDIDFNAQDFKILPEAYCKIVKNIINNSLEFKPEFILASVGKEKCDSGMFASKLLKDMGFKVVETKFENINNRKEIKISS